MNLHYSIDILILSLNDFKKKQVYNVCLFLSRIFKAVSSGGRDGIRFYISVTPQKGIPFLKEKFASTCWKNVSVFLREICSPWSVAHVRQLQRFQLRHPINSLQQPLTPPSAGQETVAVCPLCTHRCYHSQKESWKPPKSEPVEKSDMGIYKPQKIELFGVKKVSSPSERSDEMRSSHLLEGQKLDVKSYETGADYEYGHISQKCTIDISVCPGLMLPPFPTDHFLFDQIMCLLRQKQ